MFVARLLEETGTRRPDIAFLVIEARGTAGMLAKAGLAGDFDLQRHESIMVSEPVPTPKDIYAGKRVLLVPSLWEAGCVSSRTGDRDRQSIEGVMVS